MSISGCCRPIRDTWDRTLHGCYQPVPCLSDPAARSSLCLKVTLLMLHLVCVGVIFLLDRGLIEKTRKEPWYTAIYLLLLIATLAQYFFTSGSSPGYVLDAMRTADDTHSIFNKTSTTSKQYASDKNRNLIITVEGNRMGRNYSGINTSSWMKLVMSMYPPGSSVRGSTCTYCHIVQPPRSKHCHDCDKCVLQFDHHCVWLGTCIGQGNHCRFWWYIFGETALCIWTCILYITYLKANISRTWWKDVIVILLLAILSICLVFLLLLLLFHSYLVLTNQTTYELVRRRRISYLRGIPERVYPFSKGICRNLYNFCWAQSGTYVLEPLPTEQEIGVKSRPYTCVDVLSCRCC